MLLADKRINPTARNNEPLFRAVMENRIKVVKLLLDDSRVLNGFGRFMKRFESKKNVIGDEMRSFLVLTSGIQIKEEEKEECIPMEI